MADGVEPPFVAVATVEAIEDGSCEDFRVGAGSVLVCRIADRFYAVADTCTHDNGPLGSGELDGCEVECPRHGARFDVRTGKVTALPAVRPIATYPVRVVDGVVEVQYRPPERPRFGGRQPFRGIG